MKLTEQQIFDYIFCPAKYQMKYIRGQELAEAVTMQKLISKVSKYFYFNLLNGKVCSMNELKSKWDSVCQQYPYYMDGKKNLDGYGKIISLVRWAANEEINVGDVDQSYRIVIDNIEVSGSIETILVKKDRKIEILYTSFADKLPDQYEVDMKLKYTMDAFAFATIYNHAIDGLRVHSIKDNKDYYSYRTEPDYTRLKDTIRSVAKGIENNIFYPRENNLCTVCTSREYCKYWNNKN